MIYPLLAVSGYKPFGHCKGNINLSIPHFMDFLICCQGFLSFFLRFFHLFGSCIFKNAFLVLFTCIYPELLKFVMVVWRARTVLVDVYVSFPIYIDVPVIPQIVNPASQFYPSYAILLISM